MSSLWKHPLPLHIFIQETDPFHLRIDDIIKLNPGDQIDVLCLDRNIFDTTSHNEENIVMSVKKFFQASYQGTYTHVTGLKGTFKFTNIDYEDQNFEFHIEWKKDNWYPLKNGKLESDEQFIFPSEFENRSWESFSSETRIGWRGPMILKKWYKYLPKVYNMDISDFQHNVNVLINTV